MATTELSTQPPSPTSLDWIRASAVYEETSPRQRCGYPLSGQQKDHHLELTANHCEQGDNSSLHL